MPRLLPLVLLLGIALSVNGCAKQAPKGFVSDNPQPSGTQPAAPRAGEAVVRLTSMQFNPRNLRIPVGTTVEFRNEDSMQHDVAGAMGKTEFKSPTLDPGQAWSYTFTQKGTYDLKCLVAGHYALGMVGTVIVE